MRRMRRYPSAMSNAPASNRNRPLVGWRLLALLYDFFPMLGIWFLIAVAALALHGGEAIRSNTLAGGLEFIVLLAVTGLYATISWRRGGQTIGMKPWRLYVTDVHGRTASWKQLWLRYAVGIVSLACAGAGFWWAWIDRDGLAWHDRASGTRMIRDVGRDALQASREHADR